MSEKYNGPKVLIMEYASGLLEAWAEKFHRYGFQVLPAASVPKALELAQKQHPDLVVVDLPTTEGQAAVNKIKKYKWASKLPVIFLNNWKDPEIFFQHENGLNEYLPYNWSLAGVVKKAASKLKLGKPEFSINQF